jgi:Tol biopolymer transport system component
MRRLLSNQVSELVVYDCVSKQTKVIYRTHDLIEAPNWTFEHKWLIFNQDGRLYRIDPNGTNGAALINSDPINDLNNDHVLDPNGRDIYVSSNDGHLYRLGLEGGIPTRVTQTDRDAQGFRHYLHGVSPDGANLAYVGLIANASQVKTWIYTFDIGLGVHHQLTNGDFPVDGPEYSPDGQFIYFNAEFPDGPKGGAQIFRMRADGTEKTQLTHDDRVNWFPHISPDNQSMAFLSYPKGTLGHPADRDVMIKIIDLTSSNITTIDRFNGGQGTINVNSWAPTSDKFAYVRYPIDGNPTCDR